MCQQLICLGTPLISLLMPISAASIKFDVIILTIPAAFMHDFILVLLF